MSIITTENDLIQNYTKQQAADDSSIRLLSSFNGVLATVMRDTLELDGYPFGSVVPFCLSRNNEIVVLISDLAQHTKNIKENAKVSITIYNNDEDNIQKGWRLTIVGDAVLAEKEEIADLADRYERYYPDSRKYHEVHDFNFYVIKPKKGRYINGFGQIHWVNCENMMKPTIFDAKTEADIITHMNEDHHDSLLLFLKSHESNLSVTHPELVRMVQVDQYGFAIAHDETIVRFTFNQEAKNANDIRLFLVEMVQKARAA